MDLSLKELKLIAEALGTLDLEYGRPDAAELEKRFREAAARREEEIRSF